MMIALFPMFAAAAAATSPHVEATPASYGNAAAKAVLESDWVLHQWALKKFDADADAVLSDSEAGAAAQAFRTIADADGDGRVTRYEYRQARDFILARY